jgi:hypothetical protein
MPQDASMRKQWEEEALRELQSRRRTHPVVRLTEEGPHWGAEPRPDDEIGYGMHPFMADDCMRCAIATATQVPIEQVPNLKIYERVLAKESADEISRSTWDRIIAWAERLELSVMLWERRAGEEPGVVPKDLPDLPHRWVGVVDSPESSFVIDDGQVVSASESCLGGHCLVMGSRGQVIFDPACSVKPPPGMKLHRFFAQDVSYGISFQKEE